MCFHIFFIQSRQEISKTQKNKFKIMKNLFNAYIFFICSFFSLFTNFLNAEQNQSNETYRLKQGDLKRDYFKCHDDDIAAGYCQIHLLKNQQEWDTDIISDKEVNRLFHLIPLIEHWCQERYCRHSNSRSPSCFYKKMLAVVT